MKSWNEMTPADLSDPSNARAALWTISDLDALVDDLISNCPEARPIIMAHDMKNIIYRENRQNLHQAQPLRLSKICPLK
jgi:hypothetical protein